MSEKEDRERLLRIISLCLSVEKKGSNPFNVAVKQVLDTLKKYLPHWKTLNDFVLDAETLNSISSVVRLQGNWIRHRSTTLFVDPLMIELKLKILESSKLVQIFQKSWHPILEMDRLSEKRVGEAIIYWNQLLSLKDRSLKLPEPSGNLGFTSIEELIKSRIVSGESFNDLLRQLWIELKKKVDREGKILYWDFIYASSYDETILRAYLTSFMVTYGFATMEIDAINETSFLIPLMEPKALTVMEPMVSIPISIDYASWKKMTEDRKIG